MRRWCRRYVGTSHEVLCDLHTREVLGAVKITYRIRRKYLTGLSSFDDEHGLVVDPVLFTSRAQLIVFFHGIIQEYVADFLCRLAIVFTHYLFQLPALFLVATVVHTVRIKKEDVSRADQRKLGQIRRSHSMLPRSQREIFRTIGMVVWNLQAERQK